MYFRFGSAVVLVVLISLAGTVLEKRTLELRRGISRQHYRMDVLREKHARVRLRTEQLGAPARVIESLETGRLQVGRPERRVENGPKRSPLLRWQQPAHDDEL